MSQLRTRKNDQEMLTDTCIDVKRKSSRTTAVAKKETGLAIRKRKTSSTATAVQKKAERPNFVNVEGSSRNKNIENDVAPTSVCSLCDEDFQNSDSYHQHRRRNHVLQTNVTFGDYIVSVPFQAGCFRCPLASCPNDSYGNIDTFKKHMDRHGVDTQVGLYETVASSPTKRMKMESPIFDHQKGCSLALPGIKEETAHHQTMGIECSPLALHLNHRNMSSKYTTHALMRNDLLLDLVSKVPFHDGSYSEQVECTLQMHNKKVPETSTAMHYNSIYVEKVITSSYLPGLNEAFSFAPPTEELIDALNTDFRVWPSLLHAISVLHTGCLIINGHDAILTLSAEAYSRSKSLDVHGETSTKSIPVLGSVFHGLSVDVHEESDGKPAKLKLKFGSKTMNVLITMSTVIKTATVYIGPQTPIVMDKPFIFYDAKKQKDFLAIVKQHRENSSQLLYNCPMNVSSLRQLSSGFGNSSTYLPWRATLYGLDSDLLQPVTVFTLTDIPGNQGYGVSDKSVAKIASSVLQAITIAIMSHRPLPSEDMKKKITSMAPDTKEKSILALLAHLKDRTTTGPLDFANFLPSIAKLAASALSDANQKIKANVQGKLVAMYGK